MARLQVPDGPGKTRDRLFGLHRPDIGAAINQLSAALNADTQISVREREFVRMRIALINNCHT